MQAIILTNNQSVELRKIIKSKKIKYKMIAKTTNMSYQYISKMIRGSTPINQIFYEYLKKEFSRFAENVFPQNYVIYPHKQTSDLSILLQKSNQVFYWIGFLLTDGHFTKQRIDLSLSEKDEKHLEKFCNFIKFDGKIYKKTGKSPKGNKTKFVKISTGNKEVISRIRELFDIKSDKTHFAPSILPKCSRENIISLLIGIIDGDGCISKRKKGYVSIEIEMYKSWEKYISNLIEIAYECCGEKTTSKFYTKTTFKSSISNPIVMKFLKRKTIEFNLPVLERKWSNIDENKISKYEIQRKREILLPSLIKQGLSLYEISEILNMHKTNVCRLIKRLKIKSPSKIEQN